MEGSNFRRIVRAFRRKTSEFDHFCSDSNWINLNYTFKISQLLSGGVAFLLLFVLNVNDLLAQSRNLEQAYSQARELSFAGNYDEALQICDSVLTVNPDYFDTEILQTRVMAWSGDLKKADSLSTSLRNKYPENRSAAELGAIIKTWREDFEGAESILEPALERWPSDPVFMQMLGKGYVAQYNYTAALIVADSLEVLEKKPEGLELRIMALMGLQELDSAIVVCDQLVSLDPNNLNSRHLRAKCKALNKLYPDGLADLDTVLQKDSTYIKAYYLRNNIFFWTGENYEAIDGANLGLKFFPEDLSLLNQLSKALLRSDSLNSCDSVVEIILEGDSLNYEAWAVGLNSRLIQEDYDSVLNALDRLDTVYVMDDEFKRLRVLSYSGKKKYSKAIDAMANDPAEVDSMEESDQVLYTKLHFWNREYNKSLKLVDRYLAYRPSSVRSLALKTRILSSRYEKKEAIQTVDDGLEVDSTDLELKELKLEVEKINLNELGGWLTYDFYSNSTSTADDRKAFQIEYIRRIKRQVILGRLTVANRFDSTGIQGEIDFYPVVTDWLYFYSNVGASNNWLFPQFRAAIEPHFVLPATLVLSAGVRYMSYPGNDVFIFTGSVNAYPGQFYLSFRPYITGTNNGVNQSYNARVRRFFNNPRTYVELSGGVGASPDNTYLDQAFDQLVDSRSFNIGVTYQQQFNEHLYGKAFVIFDQYYPDQIPNFNIISTNIGLWWMF